MLRRGWALLWDAWHFVLINVLQRGAPGGSNSLEEVDAYLAQWTAVPWEEYYAIPAGSTLELPDHGRCLAPTCFPSGMSENDRYSLRLFPCPQGWSAPTMIILHGLMSAGDGGYAYWAHELNKLGWNAIIFHLPYHYARRPKGSVSGQLACTSNVLRTVEGVRQAVIELRLLIRELRGGGCERIGLWGTSYGAWVGALTYAVEPGLATAWLLTPVLDIDAIIWDTPACVAVREQLRRGGHSRERLRPLMPLVCPSHHDPASPADQVLLLAGQLDHIAPPATIRRLQQRWLGSRYYEYPQGHVGYQLMGATLRLARQELPHLFQP